jgi:NDP-sugar pyrophosphorylase family protein
VRDTPKPLLDVAGQPFILHQLRLLAAQKATRAVICVGYLGEQIVERVGREQFGIEIEYSHDGAVPIGTLGAVRKAASLLGDHFLVLYGDTYLRMDYGAAAAEWLASGLPGMMAVLRNEGRWDASNVEFDGRRVLRYDKRAPTPEMDWIDYGLGGLEVDTLDRVDTAVSDLSDLYHSLSLSGSLLGFAVTERFYEIGTPEALAEAESFFNGHGAEVEVLGSGE